MNLEQVLKPKTTARQLLRRGPTIEGAPAKASELVLFLCDEAIDEGDRTAALLACLLIDRFSLDIALPGSVVDGAAELRSVPENRLLGLTVLLESSKGHWLSLIDAVGIDDSNAVEWSRGLLGLHPQDYLSGDECLLAKEFAAFLNDEFKLKP